jgi:hypothetical protein
LSVATEGGRGGYVLLCPAVFHSWYQFAPYFAFFFFWQHIFPNPQPVALPCLVAAIFREKDETKMRVVKDV